MAKRIRLPFRLVVVSNRGPYHLYKTKKGLKRERTIGGLVSSILPMLEKFGGVWVAAGEPAGRYPGKPGNSPFDLRYLSITAEQNRLYYQGLANSALWPLSHYFLGQVHYHEREWQAYQEVNRIFAEAALEEAGPEDVIWVHDYQLALVPGLIRKVRPKARIAFFWHIPFPAVEVFSTFPWRITFLENLAAADIVGFHIPEYTDNFAETVVEILDGESEGDCLHYDGRSTRLMSRPIGIDYDGINKQAHSARTRARSEGLRAGLPNQKIILGVERMDYTKGVFERLQAMERLLETKPELHGKVTLIQIVTPSRSGVEAYRQRKRDIDEIVGRINGRFSDGIWIPIRYFYRAVSPAELISYFVAADIALVTPLRDGLNLVAKEFVASRVNQDGVLILSEFAGVAYQLPEALLVNPYSVDEMANALWDALQMPKDEQQRRMQAMQETVSTQNIEWWAQSFFDQMAEIGVTVG